MIVVVQTETQQPDPSSDPDRTDGRPPFAGRSVLLVVGLKCALNLAVAGLYGWQRDELYYAVAGRHLQGGYVEFPPLTALASALAHALFGWSLVGFRLFAVLAGAGTILVAAATARELGGGRRAQVLAAVLVGFSPLLLATNGLFQPVSFDQLATMLVLWLVLRLALGHGSWLLLGLAVGVGLETKYTLGVVLVVLVVAVAIWRRDLLRERGLLVAVAVAAVLVAPNLVWEARHGWVTLHWLLHPGPSATSESRPQYVVDLLLLTASLRRRSSGAARRLHAAAGGVLSRLHHPRPHPHAGRERGARRPDRRLHPQRQPRRRVAVDHVVMCRSADGIRR